jgi:hypothetical protein
LVFANEDGLLTSNELLADPQLWNAFSLREMSLIFQNVDTGNAAYVGAYIGQIEQVPEPASIVLMGVFCLLLICTLRRRMKGGSVC